MRIRSTLLALLITAACLFVVSCSDDNPVEPQSEVLDSFSVEAPPAVTTGQPFTLAVAAVGSDGTKPFTSFDGIVYLSASAGTVAPDSMNVTDGSGSGQVVLSGSRPDQTITATHGTVTGSAELNAGQMSSLEGADGDLASEAIPGFAFVADGDDYSTGHPSLPGALVSHSILMVAFEPTTTVGQANTIIADLGAGIVGGVTGVDGEATGILFLKLPTSTHAEAETAVASLDADPAVAIAVQDVLLGADAIPRNNDGTPPLWTWETVPVGDNWGLERIGVPQMWNFNAAVQKKLNTQAFSPPAVLIVDTGFASNHPDVYTANFRPVIPHSHGAHVSGIIGATFNNGKGIDGICPHVFMLGMSAALDGGVGAFPDRISAGQAVISGLYWGYRAYVDVINVSLGYSWSAAGINPATEIQAQKIVAKHAALTVDALNLRSLSFRSPLIVVSSGDDNGADSRYNSPLCYAALLLDVENILVVESVSDSPGSGDGNVTKTPESNVGGHVSAPGADVWGTTGTPPYYRSGDGTSYAAAMASGVAAYISLVEPYITHDDMKDVILTNALSSGGGAQPRIDAWASVVDIDRVRGGTTVLEMMCDIDDGTLDGNQRLLYTDGTEFLEEDADGDGGVGDGNIDMSDFRRWRDWYLLTQAAIEFDLDGAAAHRKKDVNHNLVVEAPAGENRYPRGDFNGDGGLELNTTSWVPGAVGSDATDLDVFRSIFNDPVVQEGDLPGLVESFDVHLDLGWFLEGYQLSEVHVEFWRDESLFFERTLAVGDSLSLFTLPCAVQGYELEIEFDGPHGNERLVFGHDPDLWTLLPGEDVWIEPVEAWEIDPKAAYLHLCFEDDGALETQPVDLAAHGIQPGDYLLIDQVGHYDGGGGWTNQVNMAGVFSSSSTLSASGQLHRVPGAIDAGQDIVTIPTHSCGGEATDIPEDFEIYPYVRIQVPAGAKFLFIAPDDSKYEDNYNDGHYGVQVSKIRMKGYR